MMNKISGYVFIMLLSFSFFIGCATTRENVDKDMPFTLTDISKGLPQEGLWRENIVLVDFDRDGYLDIVTPPPRKAKVSERRPFIFLRDIKEGKWKEGTYQFPSVHNYGVVAVGDVNNDGYPDIVLAVHSGSIRLFLNDGKEGFKEESLPIKDLYHSRSVALSDINGDGWLDIVSLSEAPFSREYVPPGILVGINEQGRSWHISIVEESSGSFGDYFTVADINGDRIADIVIAPQIARKEYQKILWLGDGKGSFTNYPVNVSRDMGPFIVRSGDVDGDGQVEIVFLLEGIGIDAKILPAAFKWTGKDLREISSGLEVDGRPLNLNLADIDNDKREELIVLTDKGFYFFKYRDNAWLKLGHYPLPDSETAGARDLKIQRQGDGSWIIVYTLGTEQSPKRGIRAYSLR